MSVWFFSAPPDHLVDRNEGLLQTQSLHGAAGLDLPQPVREAGEVQLGGDLRGGGGKGEEDETRRDQAEELPAALNTTNKLIQGRKEI